MEDECLDVCVLTSMHNVKYFSNFLYCSFGRAYAFVVSPTHVTLLSAGIDSFQPRRMIRYNNLKNQAHIIYTDWNKWNFFEALKVSVPGFCEATRVGFEADHMNLQLKLTIRDYCFGQGNGTESVPVDGVRSTDSVEWSDLGLGEPGLNRSRLNNASTLGLAQAGQKNGGAASPRIAFFNVSATLMEQRLVKSVGEISLIRQAAQIANAGCAVMIANLETGIRECDLATVGVGKMKSLIVKGFPTTELCDTWIW